MATIENLTTATPAEIDTELYRLYSAEAKAKDALIRSVADMHRTAGDKGRYVGRSGRKAHTMEWTEVLETLIRMAHREVCPSRDALRSLEYWTKLQTELKAAQEQAEPLHAEFTRRGGWDRAFLVQNDGGHVHSSMNCSTCNNGEYATSFVWMTEYSGQTEEQIVEAAGERACTVCYISAPVETLARPSKMFGPEELAKKAAADERAVKASEKALKAAAKAITDVDGSPLREKATGGSVIKTLVSARTRLTDYIEYQDVLKWGDYTAEIDHLAKAIAAKEEKTAETVIAEAAKRAAKRR
jgi:hypothetical protein